MTCTLSRGFSLGLCIFSTAVVAGCMDNDAGGLLGGTALNELSALTQDQPAICDPPPAAFATSSESTVSARADGHGYLYLDASESTAPARGELSFTWIDNGKEIASGEYIYVRLSEGTHDVKLVVRDFCGNEAADTVRVTVQPLAQTQ